MTSYGFDKLTEALRLKNIDFETVTSYTLAKGKKLIVVGLVDGNGLASRLLKEGNHTVPKTAESLTIRKIKWKNKQALVISGYDEKGAMYALLDVANRISWSTDHADPLYFVKEITSEPYVKERGISIYTMNRAYWESRFYDDNFWI